MNIRSILFICLLGITFFFSACEKQTIQPVPVPVNISFKTDVYLMLKGASCSGCHNVSNPPDFSTVNLCHATLLSSSKINKSQPANSPDFILHITDHNLNSSQINIIKKWLSDGAKNN